MYKKHCTKIAFYVLIPKFPRYIVTPCSFNFNCFRVSHTLCYLSVLLGDQLIPIFITLGLNISHPCLSNQGWLFFVLFCLPPSSLVAQLVKESTCNVGDLGSTPGLGISPGEGNGKPVQCSCLENPMYREAWKATVPGVAKSQTRLPFPTSKTWY